MNIFTKSFAVAALGLGLSTSVSAQNNISLSINHHLNAYDFSFTQESITPDSILFTVERMQYYLSEFTIYHDGGDTTEISDLWALIDASQATNISLGSLNIDSIEAISFGVGVNPEVNHLDPSTYSQAHPLAHKNPSMHWGWTAGYRFVAMEGRSEGQRFEVHALGDGNYFTVMLPVSQVANNGSIELEIFGDYSKALGSIEVNKGIISHGETGEAADLLLNFNSEVFSLTAPTDSLPSNGGDTANGIFDVPQTVAMNVYPNPTLDGTVNIEINSQSSAQIKVFDITGKLVSEQVARNRTIQLSGLNAGIYILKATDQTGAISLEKLVVR